MTTENTCELRFDIPLTPGASGGDRGFAGVDFERAWRAELSAQKMTALAMPPAQALGARFRVCGPEDGPGRPELERTLISRLAALPGGPAVAREPSAPAPGWSGVRVWLTYRAADLPALLGKADKTKADKTKTHPSKRVPVKKAYARRGPRP